jgi:hypothetical protein
MQQTLPHESIINFHTLAIRTWRPCELVSENSRLPRSVNIEPEVSANFYKTTWRKIAEDSHLKDLRWAHISEGMRLSRRIDVIKCSWVLRHVSSQWNASHATRLRLPVDGRWTSADRRRRFITSYVGLLVIFRLTVNSAITTYSICTDNSGVTPYLQLDKVFRFSAQTESTYGIWRHWIQVNVQKWEPRIIAHTIRFAKPIEPINNKKWSILHFSYIVMFFQSVMSSLP